MFVMFKRRFQFGPYFLCVSFHFSKPWLVLGPRDMHNIVRPQILPLIVCCGSLLCLSWSRFLWPFAVVHWQKTFKIISLISGRLGSSLEHPYCSDVCIWRPYYRRGRAGCLCWCILWDRQCHTRVFTGPLIFPVDNKNKGKVWLRCVLRPWVQLGCLPAEAGVPVYHLTRGAHSRQQRLVARTRNVLWVRANALWRQEYGSWQK